MRLLVSQENIGRWAATYIQQKIATFTPNSKRPFVLGLPTGGTVVDMYAYLCTLCQQGALDFSFVITFNMDEYVGLAPDNPQSYHFYMKQHLFDGVNIPLQQAHLLNGQAADLQKECNAYETAITQAGGIHLFLGGVGRNGHLAFNEPGSSFTSRTRPVTLEPSTRKANARFFDNDETRVPTQALSVGIGTVLDAKELLFLASGEQKAQAVSRLSQGEITPQWPITALQTHPNATLLTDEAAASKLTGTARQSLLEEKSKNPTAPVWCIHV